MSVRKRAWMTRSGESREAWIADYVDQQGDRHIETFAKKKDADAHHATVKVDVRQGIHTPSNKSITVAEAADQWVEFVELEGRERSTVAQYRQHAKHITGRIGREKLANLTSPKINSFRDDLLANMSRALAKKVLTSLKALLKDAKNRGNVAQNVAADVKIKTDKRSLKKLKVGVDIPTPDEIRSILGAAKGRWRPLLITAVFTGLRSSELRGLTWADLDLKAGKLHVRQRADKWGTIGNPKSETSDRTVPLGPLVLNTLREWKLVYPRPLTDGSHESPRAAHLVFPTGAGRVETHSNILRRGLRPPQIEAGIVDKDGNPKYTGLHALRHFFASWCINRKQDGGLELPIKMVQQRLGHSSIVMTSDVYGHLFPSSDDGVELAAAERALMPS